MPLKTSTLDASAANEYADYAGLGTLLTLQRPRTGAPAELSFLVVTQVMELYFTLLRHEWQHARAAITAGEVREAVRTLRRGHGVQDALTAAWEGLRTLTPAEFDSFRDSFGPASGIQSYQYRHIEFLLGARHPGALAVHERAPQTADELRAQAVAPSLYDAALGLLYRRGLPVPADLLARDHTVDYPGDPRAVALWRTVHACPEGLTDLADLGDALFDAAERHLRWKQRHLLVVWRALGDKPGSAGTSGARWLERGVHRKYFPDLWALRGEGGA